MRTFDNFPEHIKCKLCGTDENKECTLIPIDGTDDGGNCEATPVHTDCIKHIQFRYNKTANIFYTVAVDEELLNLQKQVDTNIKSTEEIEKKIKG